MKHVCSRLAILSLLSIIWCYGHPQTSTSLPGFSNGSSLLNAKNPFKKFIGEWTLKEDNWYQNWGAADEHIKIPNHHTICTAINTDNSLLAVIDGAPPHGHIFWSYNPVKKEVDHLSSF